MAISSTSLAKIAQQQAGLLTFKPSFGKLDYRQIMSTAPIDLQASASETAKPKRRKPSKSIKPDVVKAAIIAKSSMGLNKSQIAKDLDIDRATVSSVLSISEIQQHVSEIRSDMVLAGDLWQARRVMKDKLDKGSESAATTILRGFNVLQSGNNTTVNVQNAGVMAWIQLNQAKQAELDRSGQPDTTTNSDPTPSK